MLYTSGMQDYYILWKHIVHLWLKIPFVWSKVMNVLESIVLALVWSITPILVGKPYEHQPVDACPACCYKYFRTAVAPICVSCQYPLIVWSMNTHILAKIWNHLPSPYDIWCQGYLQSDLLLWTQRQYQIALLLHIAQSCRSKTCTFEYLAVDRYAIYWNI